MLQDPGGRAPAPEPLRALQAFVNTLDIENGIEVLETPDRLEAVLREHDLLARDETLDRNDLRRAIAAREALRRLLLG